MPDVKRHRWTLVLLLAALCVTASEASAQDACKSMRKINIGVAVAPPNVVHTAPYVAKALGYFARLCIDAEIIQFEGGQSQTANVAVAQGRAIISVNDVLVGRGMKVQQIWGLAPRMPQAYVVQENIRTPQDLKGKRLSATGGGVGGFNWRAGRAVLRSVGLDVNDAHFIPSATAGRLPGLIANQVDAVALHPEDVFLAQRQKPSLHALVMLADMMPLYQFNSYGASLEWIARDRPLLVDTVAAMIMANRTMYREPAKAIAAIVDATKKPRDAVEFAIAELTRHCVWSVNEGMNVERTQWSIENSIENGDIKSEQKPTVEQVSNMKLAGEAVDRAGGRVTLGECTL